MTVSTCFLGREKIKTAVAGGECNVEDGDRRIIVPQIHFVAELAQAVVLNLLSVGTKLRHAL
jgi:hypothetical protein